MRELIHLKANISKYTYILAGFNAFSVLYIPLYMLYI